MSHDNLEITGSILVVFNFCALNQTTESMRTSFSPQTPHQSSDSARVLARTSPSPVRAESELSYIGVPAKLAPASPRGLTWTPHKLAWTPSDSVAFCIGMVRNTWGRVKTSTNSTTKPAFAPKPMLLYCISFHVPVNLTPALTHIYRRSKLKTTSP